MNKLNDKELSEVSGGFSWGIAALVAAGIVFISGLLDGYINPKTCNN